MLKALRQQHREGIMKTIAIALALVAFSVPAYAATAAHEAAAGLLEFHKSGEFEDEREGPNECPERIICPLEREICICEVT